MKTLHTAYITLHRISCTIGEFREYVFTKSKFVKGERFWMQQKEFSVRSLTQIPVEYDNTMMVFDEIFITQIPQ